MKRQQEMEKKKKKVLDLRPGQVVYRGQLSLKKDRTDRADRACLCFMALFLRGLGFTSKRFRLSLKLAAGLWKGKCLS
ncbi:hypothetical protein CEXT_627631 [Caerostris extrusa]|uniref:Uncharacterized protein n=1 Tax=Caerostris extrusa TaxID=172846 RepID=A0AAV4PVZ7_CAEEX|nr:hypothetical protein CEXT_627631 [Caerostris extrusa]